MIGLQGKKVLVTGGSRGIGAGICQLLSEQGCQLALTYTSRPDAAEKVLSQLQGEGHQVIKMDISESDSVKAGVDQVLESFGQIDGVVNNAGITKDQLLMRMKDEDFDQVIRTNLRGTYLVSKAVLKPMIKARKGSIVCITSVVGQMGNPGQANYAASKAGTEGFAKSLAKEVASRNVRVNCVAPGYITTDMTADLDEKQTQSITNLIPMERMGQVEDVAQAVAFLLSDASTYMTGQTLAVNGGMYM